MNYEGGSFGEDRAMLTDAGGRPSRRRWLIPIGAAVIVVVAAVLLFARHGNRPAPAAAAQLPSISVIVPGRQMVDRTIAANGSLAAKRDMPVGVAGEGGEVSRVLVEPGQWVAAGQVLATIDASVQAETAASLAAQIKVAQSDRDIAQSELDRANALVDRGFISKADLQRKAATRDAAAARVKVAQATLAETRARNRRLDIRAPTAGLVLTRQVEPGQIVGASSGMLFRIAMDGQMEMRAALAEGDLAALHAGARAQVTPVGGDRAFAGTVWQVSPVIDSSTRQGIARIQLAYDPALRPGGFASATIVAGASSVPMLPQSAVLSDDKGNYVYVVGADDKVAKRPVTAGAVVEAGVPIIAGLNGTERVVLSAGAFLSPGQKIKPQLAAAAKVS